LTPKGCRHAVVECLPLRLIGCLLPRMADVALKKVSARLASLLLRLLESEGVVNGEGVSTRYTHEQLATMVGSKRVAVSRALGELRRVDAVEVKGRRVYLKDKAALRRAAEVGSREV
jgi:CRP/FNR family transcriptional regulator, cyclic AMP receptor protein